jgi:hypothetical protein
MIFYVHVLHCPGTVPNQFDGPAFAVRYHSWIEPLPRKKSEYSS